MINIIYQGGRVDGKRGFTLIELLVVVTIIGILATIVSLNIVNARDKAKVAKVVEEMNTVVKAAKAYYADTYDWPATCRTVVPSSYSQCTSSNDPFLVANGVARWNGPYIDKGVYSMTHPWSGDLGYSKSATEAFIILDEDRPSTPIGPGTQGTNDNQGAIPDSAMLQIDKLLDDGNLQTGLVMQTSNGSGGYTVGELLYTFVTF